MFSKNPNGFETLSYVMLSVHVSIDMRPRLERFEYVEKMGRHKHGEL